VVQAKEEARRWLQFVLPTEPAADARVGHPGEGIEGCDGGNGGRRSKVAVGVGGER
jgi:hypothetical protein